jgi:hypothetical protein
MLPVLTGLLLGAWHVVSGADHLAAVTPLVIEREHASGERRPSRIGLAWGIGHASGVWLVGLALLGIGSLIPLELVGVWSERIVGVAIVAVGLWGLWRVRQGWGREIQHSHHVHAGPSRSAMGIGLIHGVAGSSHLYGVLPALALVAADRVGYLIGFGVGSIVAMGLFAGAIGLVIGLVPGSRAVVQRWGLLVASIAAVVIGTAWVALA